MKLAVFEPSAAGHRMVLHVRHIAREALARGWQVRLVTTREALEHPGTRIVLQECGGRLQLSFMDSADTRATSKGRWHQLRGQWRRFNAFAAAFRDVAEADRPDVVYVVHLNHLDKAMSLRGSPFADVPFAGMLHSAQFHHKAMGISGRQSGMIGLLQSRAFLRLLALPSLRCLLTIDEMLPEYLRGSHASRASKTRYVPDIGALSGSCSRSEARSALGLKDDDRVILVYGGIGQRKGVEHLLRAATHPRCRQRVLVLLGGHITPRVDAALQGSAGSSLRRDGRLLIQRGFRDDEQEWRLFRASDIAWVGYQGHSDMSGVLAQAASIGVPVIACSEGLIGWMSRKYEIGEVVEVSDTGQVADAINRLAEDPLLRDRYSRSAELFATKHSPDNFAKTICDAIAAPESDRPCL